MNYEETLAYLYARLPMFQRVGASAFKKDLTNTRLLCEALGQPQNAFKSVHIAGTNGKGSCSHMMASILQDAEFRVGLYTSPHYKDFRERVRVQGEMMSEAFVIDFVAQMRGHIERIEPSFFEITVVMAFEYFRRQNVDIAVIEVGMGGRFDSTNVLPPPALCLITNIDLDHQQFLGDTRAEIAVEKAGIIKTGSFVFVGERHPETEAVFEAKAAEVNTKIIFVEDYLRADLLSIDYEKGLAEYNLADPNADEPTHEAATIGLLGSYQAKNIALVVTSIGMLLDPDEPKHLAAVKTGLQNVVKNTGIMGRWQFLQTQPFMALVDAAHNAHGLKEALKGLSALNYTHLFFVFGMVSDKKASDILPLLPEEATYYFAAANIPRARPADDLQAEASTRFGLQGAHYPSVKTAYTQAMADALALKTKQPDSRPVVFVGGSIFVIAEVL
jgi:dihydrofolate synthase/folylpolyglutamate synthase